MSTPRKNLTDLVREHIDRTGDSYRTIAQKTGLSKPAVGLIVTATKPRRYRQDTLEKIAHGLHYPIDVVSRAAAVSAGLDVPAPEGPAEREDARVIAGMLDHLTDDELAMLAAMLRGLTESRTK